MNPRILKTHSPHIGNSLSSEYHHFPNPMFSMDWDLQSFGVFSSDMSLDSPFSSDGSTGYLEDALADYWSSKPNKRQRIVSCSDHDQLIYQDLDDHEASNPFMICTSMDTPFVADDFVMKEQSSTPTATKPRICCSSSSHLDSFASKNSDDNKDVSVSKGSSRKIVYPFDVVKPGGVEGDVTLQDINRRLLRRPSKAVRHPVGDYATRPCVYGSGGLGMSGKAVVALTRIHTQGRGTITIVRTKG